jgi:integration host factor subunit beta
MTKSDLLEALSAKKNTSLATADRIISDLRHYVRHPGCRWPHRDPRIRELENRKYDGYTGRNPKTKAAVAVKPKKIPFIKVGKELKEKIMVL